MTPPNVKALRQLAMTQARANAHSARAVALAGLALVYAQRIADALRSYHGVALDAAITALLRERRAAEQALMARLAGAAAAERHALAQQFRPQKRPAAAFPGAAQETRPLRRAVGTGARPRAAHAPLR